MKLTKSNKVLSDFSQGLKERAKQNVNKSSNTGTLSNSIDVGFEEATDGIRIYINMEEYGEFIDEGVKGANPNLVKNGRQKAPNSEHKFTNKMPPWQPIMSWAKAKNIRFRNAKGQFAKGDYDTIGFVLQKRIYAQGIKPIYFITEPLDELIDKFSEEFSSAYADDLIDYLLL